MPIDVQMPDGTLVQGVPEGTTQAQLQALLSKKPAAPVSAAQPQDLTNEAGISGAQESPELQAQEKALVKPNEKLAGGLAMLAPGIGVLGRAAVGATAGAVEAEPGSRASGAALGAAGAFGGELAGKVLGAGIQAGRSLLDDAATEAVNFLKSKGITLGVGQQTGRAIGNTRATDAQQANDLTKTALSYMGVNSERASTTVMKAGRDVLKDTYNDIAQNSKVAYDPDNLQDPLRIALANISARAQRGVASNVYPIIENAVKSVNDAAKTGMGDIGGEVFKNLQSELGAIRDSSASPYINEVRAALNGALKTQNPTQAARLSLNDQQYSAMKILQKSINDNDKVDPAMLGNAVDTARTANAAVFGSGPLADLAQLGTSARLIMAKDPAQGLWGHTASTLQNLLVRHAGYASVGAAAGGYGASRAKTNPVVGSLVGAAAALGGPVLARQIMNNPTVRDNFVKFATSNGIKTAQDAMAWAAQRGGAVAGAQIGPQAAAE